MKTTRSIWTICILVVLLACALCFTATATATEDVAVNSGGFDNNTLTGGTYYLTQDVELTSGLTISSGTVNLYLNNNALKYRGDGYASVITVNSGATLNVYDLYDGSGTGTATLKWTVNSDGPWLLSKDQDLASGYVTTTGGCITGGKGTVEQIKEESDNPLNETTYTYCYYGGGIYVSGTLNLHSGNIVGNAADSGNWGYGGGVYIASSGEFNMSGGTIIGNYGEDYGGGVYTDSSSSFTMTDGSITDNATGTYGGGVANLGTFTMEGGSITDNTAGYKGGGVYQNGHLNSLEMWISLTILPAMRIPMSIWVIIKNSPL